MSSGTRGFSLIEVMVAMAVLGIGIGVSVPLVALGIDRAADGRKVTAAEMLGTQVLERLRTEVRYDAEPTGGSLSGGPGFTLADAWKSDRLPYSSSDSVKTGATGRLATCNPAGLNDGVDYNVGPYRARHEGNEYFVCYDLVRSTRTDVPAESVEATIKVIWVGPSGAYAARWISGLLLNGR